MNDCCKCPSYTTIMIIVLSVSMLPLAELIFNDRNYIQCMNTCDKTMALCTLLRYKVESLRPSVLYYTTDDEHIYWVMTPINNNESNYRIGNYTDCRDYLREGICRCYYDNISISIPKMGCSCDHTMNLRVIIIIIICAILVLRSI
jgi:hypothetical protein